MDEAPMQVTVKLFATLRQQAGWSERAIELPMDATVADLLVAVEEDTELVLVGRPVYVAVNQEYAESTSQMHDGDVVALFPPVSGGTNRIQQRGDSHDHA